MMENIFKVTSCYVAPQKQHFKVMGCSFIMQVIFKTQISGRGEVVRTGKKR